MTTLGYELAVRDRRAGDLVRDAMRADSAGFAFALVEEDGPDHDSCPGPFAWAVVAAIGQATKSLRAGCLLTPATVLADPAASARASSTAASLMPGRWTLTLGAGSDQAAALDALHREWRGEALCPDEVTFDTSIRSLPDPPPPVALVVDGAGAARDAALAGAGIVVPHPDPAIVDAYAAAGGTGSRMGRLSVCWAATEREARQTIQDSRSTRTPGADDGLPLGPDPERHAAAVRAFLDAGFDGVILRQVGADQAGFIRFVEGELLPALQPESLRLAG